MQTQARDQSVAQKKPSLARAVVPSNLFGENGRPRKFQTSSKDLMPLTKEFCGVKIEQIPRRSCRYVLGRTNVLPMADLTDEQLIKRARHAGRNLSVLAVLASLFTLGLVAVAVLGKGPVPVLGAFALIVAFLAGAYWLLAVAAYRGDPKAPGIVIVVAGVQVALNLIISGIAAARTSSEFNPGFRSIVLPLLVLWALASSRKVLLRLQENGLWEKVFAPAKPTARLCLAGMVLLITGMLGLNSAAYFAVSKVASERGAAMRSVTIFTQLLKEEEKPFLDAMRNISSDKTSGRLEIAWAKINSLEARINTIKAGPESEKIAPVLNIYGNAVRNWKTGVSLLREANPDTDRAKKALDAGDQFRINAYDE